VKQYEFDFDKMFESDDEEFLANTIKLAYTLARVLEPRFSEDKVNELGIADLVKEADREYFQVKDVQ